MTLPTKCMFPYQFSSFPPKISHKLAVPLTTLFKQNRTYTTFTLKQVTVLIRRQTRMNWIKKRKKQQDPVYYVTVINHQASITWFQGGGWAGSPRIFWTDVPIIACQHFKHNTFSVTSNWLHFTGSKSCAVTSCLLGLWVSTTNTTGVSN